MGSILTEEIKSILNDPETIKVLATTDADGNPHVVFKGSIHANEDGYIEYLEIIETAQSNKNMVRSLWFNKKIAINIKNGNKSYQIKGKPYRSIIAGQKFEQEYVKLQQKRGNIDLSAVWLIEAEEIIDESFEKRRVEEEEAHPLLRHLDRLVVTS